MVNIKTVLHYYYDLPMNIQFANNVKIFRACIEERYKEFKPLNYCKVN